MPPVPKKKHSKARTHRRRSAKSLTLPHLVRCPRCKKLKLPHVRCPYCS